MSEADWISANQRVLVAEFSRIRARLMDMDASVAERELTEARSRLPAPAALDLLVEAFALSPFERDVLLLCAGVEMDGGIAAACAARGVGARVPYATLGLALEKLADPHWSATTPTGPLRLWRLIEVCDPTSLAASRLSVDECVMHYLAGIAWTDARLSSYVRAPRVDGLLGEGQRVAAQRLAASCAAGYQQASVLLLHGDDPDAHVEAARRAVASCGRALRIIGSRDLPSDAVAIDELARLCARESRVTRSWLLLRLDDPEAPHAVRFIERIDETIFVSAPEPFAIPAPTIEVQIDRPPAAEQNDLWKEALGPAAAHLDGVLDDGATEACVGVGVISRTAAILRDRTLDSGEMSMAIRQACRLAARRRLDSMATRVDPAATWSDLVLPDSQLATLHLIASHALHRSRVFEDWGFSGKSSRGQGISVLFTGESGTGKTMAAEVIAIELGLDLYRIDLASTVSKYIGETEKNLRRIFDAAEDSGAILLFDEADALFGPRSEVKNSHDRYANIEVSYLLQRMEAYRGLAILTTNLKGALDTAFQRRLRFVVSFPFPDVHLRERIWRGAFPPATPREDLDARRLAQLNVSGGTISNIALNAAYIAANENVPVRMSHLLTAARSEAAKRDRVVADAEVRGWV